MMSIKAKKTAKPVVNIEPPVSVDGFVPVKVMRHKQTCVCDRCFIWRTFAEAVWWYGLASDQGYAPAQNNLGNMYANGKGVPHSDEDAVFLYQKAATNDYAPAQYNLGKMLEAGRGVAKDLDLAETWLKKAAAHAYFGPRTDALSEQQEIQQPYR